MNKEIKIWPLIIHYLHKHNELCIAGLGRFAAEVHDFYVDPVSKKIHPPSRKIGFQVGEFETSPAFLDFSLQVYACELGAFVDKLNTFNTSLLEAVQSQQRLEVEQFGTFRFNVMGELDFESAKGEIFNDNSFGLKPIHFAANLLKTKRILVDKTDEREEEELDQLRESALKELKVMLDNARIAESSKDKKSSKVFPVIATVLTLILLINLGFFLFKGPVDQIKEQISQMGILGKTGEMLDTQITTPANTATTSAVQVKPDPIPAVETKPESPVLSNTSSDSLDGHYTQVYKMNAFAFDSTFYSNEPAVNPEPAPVATVEAPKVELIAEPTPEPKNTESKTNASSSYNDAPNMVNVDAQQNGVEKGFYVIAGAFKNEDNALRLQARLQKKGNAGARVFKPTYYPYYLVAYDKSNTLNQALGLLEQKQNAQPSIWVYCAY